MKKISITPTLKLLASYTLLAILFVTAIILVKNTNAPQYLAQVQTAAAATPIVVTDTKQYKAVQLYNQDGANTTGAVANNTTWIGNASSLNESYTGIAFKGVSLPTGATLQSAQLQVTNVARTTVTIGTSIAAEASSAPILFSKASPPSKRQRTVQRTVYTTSATWLNNTPYQIQNLQPVLSEVVKPGNTRDVNIIMVGTGKKNAKRDVYGITTVGREPILSITYQVQITPPTPTATPSPTIAPTPLPTTPTNPNYPKKLRVIEIRFFPFGPEQAVYQPDTLSSQLKTLLRNASSFHKFSNSLAQNSIDVETVAVYNHNTARPNPDGTWRSSYDQILAQDNICQQVLDQNIDQVWVWADPRTGYDTTPGQEYVISSKYFQDQSKIKNATYATPMFCNGQKSFVFFEFDYSRTADLALHSFGHFLEGLLANIQSADLFWKTFSGDPSMGTTRADKCGNVHYPPNGTADYDYSNTTNTTTSCEDWNPQLTGVKKTYNCTEWSCTQEGYLQWWMQNMPNIDNTLTYQSKNLPNWWDFTYDTDNTIKKYNDNTAYYMDRNFLSTVPNTNVPEINNVTRTMQNSGTQITWQHENTGTNTLLVVGATYRAHNNPSAQLTGITYNNQALTKVRRDSYNDRTSEIWYLVNPPQGNYTVAALFDTNPEAQIFTASTITNVDQANPIVSQDGTGSLTGSTTQSLTLTTNPGELAFGVLASYPNGASNNIIPASGTEGIWKAFSGDMNIESDGGVVRATGTSTTLQWSSNQSFSFGMSGIAIKLLP
jgi:hypothetical protein